VYLKTLKLAGFKSFADRTRLEFRPGVTIVVGPNGSGKSNIVDAIAWVMGTQAPRALRTEKMEDVIFAGTALRPALGRAEVTLVIDNGSGLLPLDLPEVSLTRRIYRDGSSEYEINGVGCRLLDIQELLSDAGVGRQQHVIVSQGQIDSVLNASPTEHREIIEDAAGIRKHRVRKEKAMRRLERTEMDMVRLRDLLGELERQMRPLRRQAEAAERHGELSNRVRSLRLWLAGEELRRIDRRLAALDEEQAELSARSEELHHDLAELDQVLTLLRQQAGRAGESVDRLAAAAAHLETTRERLRRVTAVAAERRRTLQARHEDREALRRDLEAESGNLVVSLEATAGEAERLRAEARTAELRFRELEDEERSLADQEAVGPQGAAAVVRGELQSLEAAERRETREAERVSGEIERLSARRDTEQAEVERLLEEAKELDVRVGAAQSRYEEARTRSRAAQNRWEEAERAHDEARVALAAARARLEAAREVVAGVADPQARQEAVEVEAVIGTIAAALDVPGELAAAVDAALGPFADGVAYRDAEGMLAALSKLKSSGLGGVGLVAATPENPTPAREVVRLGHQPLIDLLGPDADRHLASSLLGDVVLVEGWRAGWELVRQYPHLRVVTPEGDLITARGVKVAQPDGMTPAMVEMAEADLERAEIEAARRSSLLTQARREFDRARAEERAALEQLERVEAELSGVTEAAGRLRRAAEATDQQLVELRRRLGELLEQRRSRSEKTARLRARLAELEGDSRWEELAERRRVVAEEKERARAVWQEAAAALRAVEERRRMLERRLRQIDEALAVDQPPDPEATARLVEVEAVGSVALQAMDERLRELRGLLASRRETAAGLRGRLETCRRERERLSVELADVKDRLAGLEVERTELATRKEGLVEGLRRDLDVSDEEALAAPAPPDPDPAAALRTAEAELRRLGPINPLAAEEYAGLADRHAFLESQMEDLEQSRSELRKVVEALDREIETRFMEAFTQIAEAYADHFALLFPGGRGRLRLSDPDRPLESGVEIDAQPMGKKVSKMSLLSGGERSLAALAFLFAVFKARPSPFYVLDEVEAALDDANLRRFLKLIDRFRRDTQLLIVTHQQLTMEAADVLYGVTLEPGGSTKVVAKVLDKVS
jgi:chromosome segregation protein